MTCSSGFKSPAAMSARSDFICVVRRSPDDCTVLHVTATSPFRVRLLHRHADCAQPL